METKTGMIVVDYQNDFANPEGSLYVKGGEKLVEYINSLMIQTKTNSGLILTSQDWHPDNHTSFASTYGLSDYSVVDGQVKWPKHCVKDTLGADFLEGFNESLVDERVYKGYEQDKDSYSSFGGIDLETGETLDEILQRFNIKSLDVVGLATDYCDLATVQEALKLGYEVRLHTKGVAAVNVNPDDGENAINKMKEMGAKIIY